MSGYKIKWGKVLYSVCRYGKMLVQDGGGK